MLGCISCSLRSASGRLGHSLRDRGRRSHREVPLDLSGAEAGRLGVPPRAGGRWDNRGVIVGRQHELAELEAALGDARDSRARRVALVGDAGIGKTTLLESTHRAASDMTVLTARGVESEAELPFGVLLDLLRPLVGLIGELADPLARALRRALALESGDAGDRFAVGAGTLALLAAAAERTPLLVVVDDLHWADASSRSAVLFAARRLDADAVAVLVALRDDGTVADSELTGFDRLVVSGLGLEAAAAIVGASRAQAALDLTGGNPLALGHIGADAELDLVPTPVPLPQRLSEGYTRALEMLSASSRSALLVAAADDEGTVNIVTRALSEADGSLSDLQQAEDARLVLLIGGRIEFIHPLVRSAAYHAALPTERRAAHAALASAYAETGDETRHAWHTAAAAAGPDEEAAEALERLGVAAARRAAYTTAARAFERSAALTPAGGDPARRLLQAAESAWHGGQAGAAAALAHRARDTTDDVRLRGNATMIWGRVATTIGDDPTAICELLEQDAAALAGADPLTASLMLAQASDRAYFGAADVELSQRLADLAYRLAGDRPHPRVTQVKAWHLIRTGQTEAGVAMMSRACDQTLLAGPDDPSHLFDAMYMQVWAGDLRASVALGERAERAARARADVGLLPEILGETGATSLLCDGQWDTGLAMLTEALQLARETGQTLTTAYLSASHAMIFAQVGDTERLREAIAEAEPHRGIRIYCDIGIAHARALLALSRGEFEAALAPFPASARTFDTWWGWSSERIEALAHLSRAEETRAAIEDAAAVMTMPFSRARLDRCRGLVAREDEYAEPLQRSIETFASLGAEFERARSELYLGERLRRVGQRVAAREHLRAALEVFEGTGSKPWAERARRELAASGERRRRLQGVDDELTPQERQISQLVAEGRTNREVASLVFLSPKTVEAHLGRVYRKLGIGSRQELANALVHVDPSHG